MAISTADITTTKCTFDSKFNNEQIISIRADIHQHCASLIDAIKQREHQLLQELDSIEQTYRHEYQNYQTSIDALEKTRNLTIENLSPSDILDFRDAMVKHFDEEIKAIQMKIEKMNLSFEWDTHLVEQISAIGKLISKPASLPIGYKEKVTPVIKTCKLGTGTGELNYPWGVATDTNTNNIYVADSSSNRVCVFTSEGEFLFQFNGNTTNNNTVKMCSPVGIAIYENKVFVSQWSSHCIQIYYIDGTYIQQFGSHGSSKDQFSNPRGLSISPINGDIYVCDLNNNRVQIFNRDYKHKSFLAAQVQQPRDIELTEKAIFILDGNSPCVHVYDYNNNKLRSIINGAGDGYNIKNAYCMYVDRGSNIILSDYGGGCVLIFSCTGEIIHQIGNTDKMFTNPHGVMVDTHSRLVIFSQQKDACIQIF